MPTEIQGTNVKGYLRIEPPAEYLKNILAAYAESDPRSYAGKGWLPVTTSIKEGEILKVYAERETIRIDARFNIQQNSQDADDARYEIRGGQFSGNGIFLDVSEEQHSDFQHFFVCNSTTSRGVLLRWEVGVNAILDADSIPSD